MHQKNMEELVRAFRQQKTDTELRNFLKALLTPTELDEIPTRLQIVKLLKQGMPQKEIAKKLGVGIATVTRGSKELQKGHFSDV